jgi:hypothetical protein
MDLYFSLLKLVDNDMPEFLQHQPYISIAINAKNIYYKLPLLTW